MEHYTRNTLTATAWCARCRRMTEHRIDAGRKGPCLDPQHPASSTTPIPKPRDTTQTNLFDR